MKLNALKELILVWGPISNEGLTRLKEKKSMVLVSENRPSLLGLRYNIPLLRQNNINFIYCTDNMLGLLFYKGKIKKTLIFSKDQAQAIIGIPGTLYALLLSKLHNIPIEVMAQDRVDSAGLDKDASTLEGKDFLLEVDKEEYIIRQDYETISKEVLA